MLATLGRVEGCEDEREEGGKAGRLEEVWAGDVFEGWRGAGAIPSISLTCSGAATEPSSARSPAAGAVDWRARLRTVLAGGTGCPWFATNGGGNEEDENWMGSVWTGDEGLPVIL